MIGETHRGPGETKHVRTPTGRTAPPRPEGSLGHSDREAMGAFAGDPDEQRRGGFSNVDRETITTYRAGVERVRIAPHHNLKKMLLDAGLDEATASTDVEALHDGRILVLIESAIALDEIAGVIDA